MIKIGVYLSISYNFYRDININLKFIVYKIIYSSSLSNTIFNIYYNNKNIIDWPKKINNTCSILCH